MNKKSVLTGLLIITFLGSISLIPVMSEVPDISPSVPTTSLDSVSSSPDSLLRSEIYAIDKKIQDTRIEIEGLKQDIMQVLKDNQLEKVKELNNKVNQLEKSLKDISIELDTSINNYYREFSNRPWWRKLMIEVGPQYTFFDNDLKINDVVGYRLRIHSRQETFRRYHTYPFITASESPIREVISSPFIIEYRSSQHEADNLKKKVQVDTYLTGFGLTGQLFQKTFITLSIMGGLQNYSNTKPDDIGPIFAYSMGMQQHFSNSFSLGLIATEDWTLTKATQVDSKTRSFFNFSLTLSARLKF